MLKRIRTQDLTVGMFLHEFCGSWMEHPFWRSQFLLDDPADLARISNTSIQEVWIDTARGCDVAPDTASTSRAQVDAAINTAFSHLAARPNFQAPPEALRPLLDQSPANMKEEAVRAAFVCRRAKQAVIAMFQQARLGQALEVDHLQELVEDISASIARHPGALISLARLKNADDYTYMHSVAVCALMMALGRQIGLSGAQLHTAGLAGLLHDVGKAVIAPTILNKPGKLTDAEFGIIRSHPLEGHRILLRGGMQHAEVLDACLHHHEKIDGNGYPENLDKDSISLIAKMAAICDVYDAITSERPYKHGWDPAKSLHRMAEWSRAQFDLQLFQAFVKTLGIYPVGSLVRLTSGRIGVVTEQNPHALLLPHVKVFFCVANDERITPRVLNLSSADCSERISAREDPAHWRFADLNALCSDLAARPW